MREIMTVLFRLLSYARVRARSCQDYKTGRKRERRESVTERKETR